LGSKASSPLDDCHTKAGRSASSYQTLPNSDASDSSGCDAATSSDASLPGVAIAAPLPLGANASADATPTGDVARHNVRPDVECWRPSVPSLLAAKNERSRCDGASCAIAPG